MIRGDSPRIQLRPEPVPNVKRIGDQGFSDSARKNLELVIKILKDYPPERLENDIFTLHNVIKSS